MSITTQNHVPAQLDVDARLATAVVDRLLEIPSMKPFGRATLHANALTIITEQYELEAVAAFHGFQQGGCAATKADERFFNWLTLEVWQLQQGYSLSGIYAEPPLLTKLRRVGNKNPIDLVCQLTWAFTLMQKARRSLPEIVRFCTEVMPQLRVNASHRIVAMPLGSRRSRSKVR